MKQLPYTEVAPKHIVSPAPADGDYLVVSYNKDPVNTRYGIMVEPVFPWWAKIESFNGGMCDSIASGSSPSYMAERYEVQGVFLVGLPLQKRQELIAEFAQIGIELVPTTTEATA